MQDKGTHTRAKNPDTKLHASRQFLLYPPSFKQSQSSPCFHLQISFPYRGYTETTKTNSRKASEGRGMAQWCLPQHLQYPRLAVHHHQQNGREGEKKRERKGGGEKRERGGRVRRDWRERENLTKQHFQLTDVSNLFTHALLGPQPLLPDDDWPV